MTMEWPEVEQLLLSQRWPLDVTLETRMYRPKFQQGYALNTKKDYCFCLDLGLQPDTYKPGKTRSSFSQHSFMLPENYDEYCLQVMTACIVAFTHESIEIISQGGKHGANPHPYENVASVWNTAWGSMKDKIFDFVDTYAHRYPPKEKEGAK